MLTKYSLDRFPFVQVTAVKARGGVVYFQGNGAARAAIPERGIVGFQLSLMPCSLCCHRAMHVYATDVALASVQGAACMHMRNGTDQQTCA